MILMLGGMLAALVGAGFLARWARKPVAILRNPPAVLPVTSIVAEAKEMLLVPLSETLELTVRTSADAWVQVKSDGDVIFQNVLPKGSREIWTAKKELELWTANAGAIELTLNGKRLEGLGRGVKRGVRVAHAGLKLP